MARVFIEPVNGRKQMNENVNLSCALQGTYDRWDSIPWRKVIHEVTRQQRRIAKAVQQKQFGKAKRLMYLLSKSFYAKLLAVRRVTMNKGGMTPGVDGKVWLRGPEKLDEAKNLRTRGVLS